MAVVTSVLSGRLGNVLFEYAAGIAYAERTGKRWICPVHPNRADDPAVSLGFSPQELGGQFTEWREPPSQGFQEIPLIEGNVRLHGYFQSYRYFWDHIEKIRGMFPRPIPSDFTAVHFRRGDYVNNPHYAQTPLSYYEEATNGWKGEILLFTDDPAPDQIFGDLLTSQANVQVCYEKDAVKAIQRMAGCRRIAGCNSSFSLWAAFLSGHENHVFPKAWYRGPVTERIDISEIMPPHWKRL